MDTLILSLAIALGFFVQTTVGFAATLLGLPIMLTVWNIQDAVALQSIYLVLFSFIVLPGCWRHVNKRLALTLMLSSFVGLALGVQVLRWADLSLLKKALGIFVLLYVAYSFFKKGRPKLFKGAIHVLGFLAGSFSGLFGAGGPAMVMAVNLKLSSGKEIRATLIAVFAVVNIARVPLMIQSGLLTAPIAWQSVMVLPSFLVAVMFGHLFYKKIDAEVLKQMIMGLLFLMGVALVVV